MKLIVRFNVLVKSGVSHIGLPYKFRENDTYTLCSTVPAWCVVWVQCIATLSKNDSKHLGRMVTLSAA